MRLTKETIRIRIRIRTTIKCSRPKKRPLAEISFFMIISHEEISWKKVVKVDRAVAVVAA